MDNPLITDYDIPVPAAPKKRKKRRVPKKRAVMAPRPSRPEPPLDPNRPTKVRLTIKHSINGVQYGPGVVDVPWAIVGALVENEQRNVKEEQRLFENRGHLIRPGGGSVPVDPSVFDDPDGFGRLPVTLSVSGR